MTKQEQNRQTVELMTIELKRIYRKTGRKLKYAKPVRIEDTHVPKFWDSETRKRVLV